MQSSNRASQFIPFDALKGLKEEFKKVEKLYERKYEVKDDLCPSIYNRLKNINVGDKVRIEYYDGIEYINTVGLVKQINIKNKIIFVSNSKIFFEDIINIIIYD